jgi:leader peptidase (prepilin peptidase) / N-methyltransferase
MSAPITMLGGALLGMAAGFVLVPVTRRELAAALTRSSVVADASEGASRQAPLDAPARVTGWHWVGLALASGLVPAYVLHHVGWSRNALPPLLLLVGLIQLGYCDLTRRLLPKTLVYALTGAVVVSGIVVAGVTNEWGRLEIASIGAVVFFGLLFFINLMNPRWLAFGDVRLSFVVGFGLAWVSPFAVLEGFLLANVLAVVIGLVLIATHRAGRGHAVPFGFYLAVGTALVLAAWS